MIENADNRKKFHSIFVEVFFPILYFYGKIKYREKMYQVTFSKQAMGELNKLGKLEQLEVIDAFGSLTAEQLEGGLRDIGRIRREGKTYYRLRTGDWRIYFELLEDTQTLHAHYILHHKTLADFVFRFKLPFKEETMFEQEDNFWKYLETLKK